MKKNYKLQLVLATSNVHKIREMKHILKHLHLDILSFLDFPNYEPPEEEGISFQEIALKKALHAAEYLNQFVLADDSGLVVPALNGEPGIFSHRYAGSLATDKENRQKLLKKMLNLPEENRGCYYECALVLSSPNKETKCVSAICEGSLLTEERGGGGFGFDPLFVKSDYNKTFAELDEEIKFRISHRRKALDKILPYLEALG